MMTLNVVESISTLERILEDSILAVWAPAVCDHEYGGYRPCVGQNASHTPGNKTTVMQARTLWFFSYLVNSGRGGEVQIEAARHGFTFLCEKMWDANHGGFYWEVDPSGENVLIAHKHLFAQAFALLALSEFAIATNDRAATALATDLFKLIEKHARDRVHGGYQEYYCPDWSEFATTAGVPISDDWLITISNEHPTRKLLNTHLHMMEAVTNYCRLSADNCARDRLHELVLIMSNSVSPEFSGGCTEYLDRDWRPTGNHETNTEVYGHKMENITLLSAALDGLRSSQSLLTGFYRTSFDSVLRNGFDDVRGGFYQSGLLGQPANRRSKYAWAQAEGLLCALWMYRLAGDERYANCFMKTLGWIVDHQVDWANGGWHCEIMPDGEVCHGEIESWNSPYHNGRSILRCLALLESRREWTQ
jgi:mannobiose 2-epimerase